METQEIPMNMDVEKIKLYRNVSTKGVITYCWDISIIGLDTAKLQKIDDDLKSKFISTAGGGE